MIRTVQIIATYRPGNPFKFDLYQPGTLLSADMPTGHRWAGQITQLQIFTNSKVANGIDLSLINQDGDEFPLLSEVRLTRASSPVDLLPLLGQPEGLQVDSETVLNVAIRLPQNIQGENYITVLGFAQETGIPTEL